ncbi:MAG: CAP domain-containing protein [Acidobacteriota bacterium]|nr:CAP domain-containing protein [Acidobacteriota bacterium]
MALILATLWWAAAAVAVPDDPAGPVSGGTRAALVERINEVRKAHSRPPLVVNRVLTSVADARAARGAEPPPDPDVTTPQDRDAALRSGYEAQIFSEAFLRAGGDADDVLAAAADAPDFGDELVAAEAKDIGVGVSREKPPLYVLIFARSMPDFFAEKTAALTDLGGVRSAILSRVNRARAEAHLLPLRSNPLLDETALRHARDMLARSYYGHDSPEGTDVFQRSKAAGYRPRFAGENIARGQYSADEVMDGWLASKQHRDHILAKNFVDTGCAVVFGKNASGWQVLWVQAFGRP